MKIALAAAPLIALAACALAQEPAELPTPGSVVAAAPDAEWKPIDRADLLVMTLAPDRDGKPREVVIQLVPPPFSKPWVENVRTLARARWWDGTSVNRVQDNYVAQWGDATEAKPLPEGVAAPATSYDASRRQLDEARTGLPGATDPVRIKRIEDAINPDSYAERVSFFRGWPIGLGGDDPGSAAWPVHCYGHVGVGRNLAPDTGSGAELYAIIGQSQRHMDRNLAVIGRVIAGMEHLSSLPRGHGELGFYDETERHLRTPIVSVRLASELPAPPRFEYLDTASESFARYAEVRARRNDAFYTVPADGVDLCGVQVPIRRIG